MVRLISGVVLAAAAAAAIVFLPDPVLRVVAMGVAALAAHEYLQVAGTRSAARQAIGVAATMLLCWWIASDRPLDPAWLVLSGLAWIAADVLFTGRTVQEASAAAVAPLYTGAPLGMLAAVHAALGSPATLLVVALVIVSDSMQYYSGRLLGRRPLAPAISPKKTVEGAAGGLVFGTAFVAVAGAWVFPDTTVASRMLLGAAGVVLGICGDLFESRLKRAAGVKDSSALIPGHGGVLDRIDALLFVSPAFYVYVRGLM
jgi:phosphatidate cytidylyltransferase